MHPYTKSAFIKLGIGILIIVLGYVAIISFLYLIGEKIRIINDTETDIATTLLLENHDDSGLYLSETKSLVAGEDLKQDIGFESVRCVYINTEEKEYSTAFDYQNRDKSMVLDINIAELLTNNIECPIEKSEVKEGVSNRVQLNEVRF